MSKRESMATKWFCEHHLKGLTIYEFQLVKASPKERISRRLVDAIVIDPGTGYKEADSKYQPLKGKRVVIVQTKAARLGMYLMGQAYFSKQLALELGAGSFRTVAICKEIDVQMEKLCKENAIEVVVAPECYWP